MSHDARALMSAESTPIYAAVEKGAGWESSQCHEFVLFEKENKKNVLQCANGQEETTIYVCFSL